MTVQFIITVAREAHDGSGAATTRLATIERNTLAPETLGLTLAEAKAILTDLQTAIVADQIAAHEIEERRCRGCKAARLVKGHRSLTCRTVFGTIQTEALRLRRCACGRDPSAGNRASFSPLGDLLPERIRRHLHGVAVREEARLGEEAGRAMWSGCQRELDELPLPNGPAYVGVDGGFVRDRAGSWFEVVAGKSIPGFRRDGPADEEPRPARCFAFVQAHDDRPRRRLLDVLASQGYALNQKLVLMSDGGESVRRLVSQIGPEAEHVLDWFHVTMRLTVLVQMTKGACPDPGWTERRLADLERLKWLLWHGHVRHAVEAAEGFAEDAWCMEEETTGEARAKPARLRAAAEELTTYLRRNADQIIDYGERHRAGERISTGFVESAINQIVAKRFSKRQSMRWTQPGAHLLLQTRTRVLNGELEDVFRRRWPAFQPSRQAVAMAENRSFA